MAIILILMLMMVLIPMLMWCCVLLWCLLKETGRNLQFVLTVVCLSGGILFFSWYFFFRKLYLKILNSGGSTLWGELYEILFYLLIFLTIVYAVRVVGERIDKGGKK